MPELVNMAGSRSIGAAILGLCAIMQSGCAGIAGLDAVPAPSLTLASSSTAQFAGDRSLQERDFFTSSRIAFSSAMTVLADLGFRPTHADVSTGFITATGSGNERIALELTGLTRSSDQTWATVVVDNSVGDKATVRIVFARSRSGSANSEATQRIISDAQPYHAFFKALEYEIGTRSERIGNQEPGFIDSALEEASLPLFLGSPDLMEEDTEHAASTPFDPGHSINQSIDQLKESEGAF